MATYTGTPSQPQYKGFEQGLPTPEERQKLYDELDLQRATQAVIWAEPAVNNALFLQAMQKAGVPNLGAIVFDNRMQPGQNVLTSGRLPFTTSVRWHLSKQTSGSRKSTLALRN